MGAVVPAYYVVSEGNESEIQIKQMILRTFPAYRDEENSAVLEVRGW